MEIDELKSEGILKQENVGYLKSKLNLQQGTLFLTPKRIVLEAHKTGVGGLGLLGALLKRKVEEEKYIFNLQKNDIQTVAEGKHGVQKGVLEITDNQNNTFRIIVKNYLEWAAAIKQKLT